MACVPMCGMRSSYGGRLPRGALGFARRRLELRGSDAGAGLPVLTTA